MKECENPLCNTCRYLSFCGGKLHDGIDCYEPSDESIINITVFSMLNKFGEDSQIDVCIEGMSELTKELIKYKRSKLHFREKEAASREHVIEEISDVMFMVEYLKQIFDVTDKEIYQTVLQKARRTKERYIDAKDD